MGNCTKCGRGLETNEQKHYMLCETCLRGMDTGEHSEPHQLARQQYLDDCRIREEYPFLPCGARVHSIERIYGHIYTSCTHGRYELRGAIVKAWVKA